MPPTDSPTRRPWWTQAPAGLELERVLSLDEAARLTNLSKDTLRRRYPSTLLRLSPRRIGMRLRDVLRIGEEGDAA